MSEIRAPHWIRRNQPFPAACNWPQQDLVAVGGILSVSRLIHAYAAGLFPMFSDDQQPVLWWSPNPRSVLFPQAMKHSRSLRQRLRRGEFRVTLNQAFEQVIAECARPRADSQGTWITRNMMRAYIELHRQGVAHSVETWREEQLVGGLYGVAISGVFSGESLFTRTSDASKCALAYLCEHLNELGCQAIDCQYPTHFLSSLGATDMSRAEYLQLLRHARGEASGAISRAPGED